VGFLLDDAELRGQLRQSLKQAPDLGRALSRLTVGRGSPRDLGAIAAGLAAAQALAQHLASARLGLPRELDDVAKVLGAEDGALQAALEAALADDLPAFARDGGFVRPGYLPKLDEERSLRDDSKRVIAGLQATYAEATGIKALKGSPQQRHRLFRRGGPAARATLLAPPHDALFRHRQTMANVMRFSTPELGELESRLSMAASRAVALELEIFADLVERVGALRKGCSTGPRAGEARRLCRAGRACRTPALRAPEGGRLAQVRDRGGAPSGGRDGAGARRRAGVRAQRLRSVR
jgi:DNA mismatch repair protein MutS